MKNRQDSLTHRAGLTFISQILQQGARFVVGVVITPIIIRGLGAELYGAWTMIQQTIGYLSLSDLRPMGTLKFTLAVKQHLDDTAEKRRQIGSALVIWACSLPLFLILGGVAIWKLPVFIRVNPENVAQVRVAIAIVVVSIAMDKVLSLPATVLRGMNLEYKAMGLNAAIILLNGGLLAFVIWQGWGLPGVAGASVLGLVISGMVRLVVAKNALSWFGMSIPEKKELIEFAKLTAWLTLSALSGLLLTASDFLLVGFLLGPTAVTVYASTGAALRMTTEPLAQMLSAANPGLAGICGQGDWQRALRIRSEMFTLAIACMTFFGVGILALNQTFVGLWVGTEYFGGQVTNLFMVLAAFCKLFFRIDNQIITGMLEIKGMALAMSLCGGFVIVLGFGLTRIWGLTGMAIANLLGYAIQWGYYQVIIAQRSALPMQPFLIGLIKPIFAALPVFMISYFSVDFFLLQGWMTFFLIGTMISFMIFCYIWFVILNINARNNIIIRGKSLIR